MYMYNAHIHLRTFTDLHKHVRILHLIVLKVAVILSTYCRETILFYLTVCNSSDSYSRSLVGSFCFSVYEDDPNATFKIFNFTLTVIIGVFGLVSNSMVVAVNRRIKTLTSTDVYITLLAITDNLLIVAVSLVGFR